MCGKLGGKGAKVLILLGDKCGFFNFSTHSTRGKVEKITAFYTIAKNGQVENNKFSKSILTKNIQCLGEYSTVNTIILEHFAQKSKEEILPSSFDLY